jgi:predicted nuclease of restriction endonuclease-like (RecB) superfamily
MPNKKRISKTLTVKDENVPTRRSRGRIREEGASFPVPPSLITLPADYIEVLTDLKRQIAAAQTRAALSVNRGVIALYWHVGGTIAIRQTISGWGDAVVERLAHDLGKAFPGLEGFSPRNIWRMRAFFLAWSGVSKKLTQAVSETKIRIASKKLPQVVSEIPWGHNIVILQQLKIPEERLWYAQQTRDHGWSRSVLQAQIAKSAYDRQGKATTNFTRALPSPQSELAQQTLKDPYNFDFLTMGREAHERVTERDLLAHVREFLLELGAGFAFIGNQVKLTVGDADYFIDLLFYHVRLRCYVVVELKTTAFKPEHAGKLNFYLSAVDDLLKHKDDQPSIGLLLCRSRNRMQIEYALRDIHKPIGVAGWETKLVEKLPVDFRGSLPTVEEIEAELAGAVSLKPERKKNKT